MQPALIRCVSCPSFRLLLCWPDTRASQWSLHSAGMAQLAVWLAIAEQGLGANLQHYAQLAGEGGEVQRYFELPETWKCMAEMVFGA